MTAPHLPNLFIIGAPKSGTTSLHEYLSLHPGISMSTRKEMQVFTRDDWREKLAWYADAFPGSAALRGESSPGYTMYPFEPSVAERIHEQVPEARLIYVVRDPVERTIANYVELFANGHEDRTIAEALTDVDEPANPHVCPSRYAMQLGRYLEHFDHSQILVVDHHDLLHDRDATLQEVFAFLGVEPISTPEFARVHNSRAVKVRYNRLGYWMVRRGIFTERARSAQRGPLVRPLRAFLSRPIDSELGAAGRRLLVETLGPEVERLRELTGKSFANWPSFPPTPVEAWRAS